MIGRLTTRARRRLLAALAACVACVAGLYAAAWLVPLPERLERRDSALLLYAGGEPMHAFLSEDERWRIGRPAAEVDPAYVRALVAPAPPHHYARCCCSRRRRRQRGS